MTDNKRILKNTLMLYIRMFISLGISLFTTRVIFQALGLADMGLYNLVGGVLSMLGFLNNSMSVATQRFLSYDLGKGDFLKLKKTFSLILTIHICLAILIFLLAETIGLWFVNNHLQIESARISAANWVYQVAVCSMMISVLQVPFTASIMAHEKMGIYAYFSLVDVFSKLAIVYALLYLPGDRLIVYALLLFVTNLLIFLFNIGYSLKSFPECVFHISWNKKRFIQIFSFSGWNMAGQITLIANDQVLNIFLNWFFGTIVNGARGIALRINGIVVQFVSQFQVALNPPIVKGYASGDIEGTRKLVKRGMKLCFLLMLILSTPFLIETDLILTLWLGESPQYTVWFTRLCLINTLIDTMTGPINTCVQATGHIKRMQIGITTILIFILPLSYIVLYLGAEPYYVVCINIVASFTTLYYRLRILQRETGFSCMGIIKETVIPCYFATILSLSIAAGIHMFISVHSIISRIVLAITSFFITCIISYFFALNQQEKSFALLMLNKMLTKLKKQKP